MDQSSNKDILREEIKSWEHFEYTLREENGLIFSKMLSECKEESTSKLLPLKMNSSQLSHCLWS
ncbi:MAG: hypothetical protein ACJ72V_01510 [Nitrososphaeraceae archaeon]